MYLKVMITDLASLPGGKNTNQVTPRFVSKFSINFTGF